VFYFDALTRWYVDHHELGRILLNMIAVAATAANALLAQRVADAHPAGETVAIDARRGFQRASKAIWLGVWCALGMGLATVMSLQSPTLLEVVLVGSPLVAIVAMTSFASAALLGARSGVTGLSPVLLVASAGCALWFVHQLARMTFIIYNLFRDPPVIDFSDGVDMMRSLRVIGPVGGIVSMLLVIHVISRFALATSNVELREAATVRGWTFLIAMTAGVALFVRAMTTQTEIAALGTLVGAAGCVIVALVALAQICKRAAAAVDAAAPIPTARVV
jgi:hypothetical protein